MEEENLLTQIPSEHHGLICYHLPNVLFKSQSISISVLLKTKNAVYARKHTSGCVLYYSAVLKRLASHPVHYGVSRQGMAVQIVHLLFQQYKGSN